MEIWRRVWREGVAPLLETRQLEWLRDGLRDDDPRLIQGATTSPPPLTSVQGWFVEGACLLSYCGWEVGVRDKVGEVEKYFTTLYSKINQRLGDTAAASLLDWYDEMPRDEMRRELLAEVSKTLAERAGVWPKPYVVSVYDSGPCGTAKALAEVAKAFDETKRREAEKMAAIDASRLGWAKAAGMKVGDLVEAVLPYILASGSGCYTVAVVVNVEPLVLVSSEGDMLWRATLYPGCVKVISHAPPASYYRAMQRWKIESEWEAKV